MKIILIAIFIAGGLFFFAVGTLGLLRLPDMYTRAHSAAKCDTLGAILSLIALIIHNEANIISLKLLLVIVFLWITNPTATHLITRARYEQEVEHNEDV